MDGYEVCGDGVSDFEISVLLAIVLPKSLMAEERFHKIYKPGVRVYIASLSNIKQLLTFCSTTSDIIPEEFVVAACTLRFGYIGIQGLGLQPSPYMLFQRSIGSNAIECGS